ncbi:hypothetical protein DSM106972_091990 [Dulcicalothrix desertica PCC 7102]|uniref:Uncharacterized protein n=1 Tax=Dulcicalothrix desertica PCC 7102 TaxID=232991 RepID=A0A3S1CM94_9CYAN|nr:hypothetical protein [Dulcicalothrix desertica]RUS94948.1 hypothetical protein DSM106972_091990 [Dulcicalothrix desertica PCC 7102]TWH62817.1 hypothetical protein CAL7102_00347 [Dulcicalothrix desertica PCC 7102]
MIKPRAVRQLPECPNCRFYCNNPFFFCEVFPDGVKGNSCIYYAPEIGALYNGQVIKQPLQNRTIEEKLVLLDKHPLFTGACPNCNYKFSNQELLAEQFMCPTCEWSDE